MQSPSVRRAIILLLFFLANIVGEILYLLVLEFEFSFQQWHSDDEIQPHKMLLFGWNHQLMILKVAQKISHCLHDVC